jgi:DNA-binding NarL/FixJ family response regulator
MATRILLVDDFLGIRNGLRSLLGKEAVEICGEAENGREAIERVRELHPHLVLLDIIMPVMNGIDAAVRYTASRRRRFYSSASKTRPKLLPFARSAGADGFVPKSAAGSDLVPALRRLLQSDH